jgi:hypothetical protein
MVNASTVERTTCKSKGLAVQTDTKGFYES